MGIRDRSDKVKLDWLADLAGTRVSGPMAAFKRLLTLRRHIRDTAPDVVVSFLTNVNVAAIPVSYTHLDVYKRQGLYVPTSIFGVLS